MAATTSPFWHVNPEPRMRASRPLQGGQGPNKEAPTGKLPQRGVPQETLPPCASLPECWQRERVLSSLVSELRQQLGGGD